jgi:predicted AAA+ superfamily ATPase
MKKSVLLLGLRGSGKTTKLKEILSESPTPFVLDGAISVQEISSLYTQTINENSFCIVATLLDEFDFSSDILSNFDVIHCDFR